jgi:hypothetical protein
VIYDAFTTNTYILKIHDNRQDNKQHHDENHEDPRHHVLPRRCSYNCGCMDMRVRRSYTLARSSSRSIKKPSKSLQTACLALP